MAYRKPFTPLQRREAVRMYRSYRKHRALLMRRFPPKDLEQRRVLDEYGWAIAAMQSELRKPDRSVNPDALNGADETARGLATYYWLLRS